MTEIAREDVEILVRAGARSNKQDDARHRAMVEAYLDFEPEDRQNIHAVITVALADKGDEQANSQLQEDLAHSQSERESSKSFRPDDEETDYGTSGSRIGLDSQDLDLHGPSQVMESPVLSFNSVLHNGDSPVFRGPTVRDLPRSPKQRLSQGSSNFWSQPRSVISDSQPEPPEQIDPVSPMRGLVEYLESFNSSIRRYQSTKEDENQPQLATRTVASKIFSQPPTSYPKGTPERVNSSSPTELSSSPSPHKIPSSHPERILQHVHNIPSLQNPVTPVISAIARAKRKLVDMVEETPLTSKSPPRKLPRSSSFPLSLPSAKLQLPRQTQPDRPSSQQEPRSTAQSAKTTEIATSSAASVVSPWANKLIIRASPPVTSRGTLTADSLITTQMHKIFQTISKDIPFTPMSQTRELRDFERGHWLVDCKAWNDELRARGWNYLGDFIGGDMAGWGVSCERSEDHEVLRVNCWGVLVPHIYYLLFLASETKIKLGNADWIGGDGVAIIRMP